MQLQTQILPPVTFLFGAFNYIYNAANHLPSLPSPTGQTYIHADTLGGRVRGTKETSRIGKSYYQFRGIPYAQPPVEDLRFEPPVPHEGWDGVLDATSFGEECWQGSVITRRPIGDEDCLYLNVYTRKAYTEDELPTNTSLHPVIAFIHGGAFMSGSANIYRPKYFLDQDVVLVTLNYRLASFGFLNTGNGLIKGNMGLKDQTLALHWIQENIRFFNGDPKRVTLMGESAGSVCTHLHTLSPLSKGLFSGAISQSGTALSPWGLVSDPIAQSLEYAEGLDCPTDDSIQMVECLKSLPAVKIARFHIGYVKALAEKKHALYGPSVEVPNNQAFLPASPLQLLRQGHVSKTPWLSGVNSGEGLVHLIPILRNRTMTNLLNSNWNELAPLLLGYQMQNKSRQNYISRKVLKYYLNDEPVSQETARETANMVSDANFFLDNHDAAILQSKVAPTYIYYYTYQGLFALGNLLFSRTPLPLPDSVDYAVGTGLNWASSNLFRRRRKSKLGICHSDEIPLLFNVPIIRREITKSDVDYDFSRKLVGIWVSFAEMGFPGVAEDIKWEPVKRSNPRLEDIQLKRFNLDRNLKIIDEPFHRRIQFWKNHSISSISPRG